MNEQNLNDQIKEGEALVAKASKLVADHNSLYEKAGIGDNFIDEILTSDDFDSEFKDKIREEHAKVISEMESQAQPDQTGKNKIASRSGVTKI